MRNADCTTPSFQSRVHVKQVEQGATLFLHGLFGGYYRQEPATAYRGRPLWSWQVGNSQAERVLSAVTPHLRIKQKQAVNALRVCEIVKMGTRRFVVPSVIPGEPLITARQAAEMLPYTYESVCQAVRKGSVPSVRVGRLIYIPESFIPVWANRGTAPARSVDVLAELEECFARSKILNRVGV